MGSKLHVISQMRNSLRMVADIGAPIVCHDVGVPACASRRVVDRPSLGGQQSALVVLMHHLC
jgi:hypothetical protein